MITLEERRTLSRYFENLADAIDLTEAQYETAIEKYTAVGKFLSVPGTLLAPYNPQIVSQGSFRIGTVTRPVAEDEEFDVDLTCRLHKQFPAKQIDLKKLVERRLSEDANYNRMLDEEHRRCWRLKYSESSRFHLDIVPSIPDDYGWITSQGVSEKLAQHAITITDIEHLLYEKFAYSNDWPKSNPEGFALWFLEIMKEQADVIRMELRSKLLLERIEDVPDYKVRTPLQRGVQLMKRHRDLMFEGQEQKPVSIIITTLAAKAYEKVVTETSSLLFYDIINRIIEEMPSFILKRNGEWYIGNPVNPLENFADKWNEDKRKAEMFFRWHEQLQNDFKRVVDERTMQEVINSIGSKFGARAINESIRNTFPANTIRLYESRSVVPAHAQKVSNPSPELAKHIAGITMPVRRDPGEQLLSDFGIREDLRYRVRIDAEVVQNGFRPFSLRALSNILRKERQLDFSITSCNVPPPFSVKWKVKNTGTEPASIRELRGEIVDGGQTRREHTKYEGAHYVECYIIKDGVCVAKDRLDVPIGSS